MTLVEPVDGWPEELTSGLTVAAIVIDGSTGDTSEFSQEIQLTPLSFSIRENGTIVTEFSPNDFQGSPLSYTIAGGADASQFTITAVSYTHLRAHEDQRGSRMPSSA